jgi:hypothetical protein
MLRFVSTIMRSILSDRAIVSYLWLVAVAGLGFVAWEPIRESVVTGVWSSADETDSEPDRRVRRAESYVGQRDRLRKQYPVVSLEERLSYEHQRAETIFASIVRSVTPESEFNSVELAPEVDGRLATLEQSVGTHWLQSVHTDDEITEGEVPLFGRLRMPWVIQSLPVKQPELPSAESSYIHIDGFAAKSKPPTEVQAGSLPPRQFLDVTSAESRGETFLDLHNQGTRQFLSPSRFGYVPSRKESAGFQSHAVTQMIDTGVKNQDDEWQIVRLDLVSLLKFEESRVYVLDHLPDMKNLDGVETRPLDEFETAALPQLVSQKDVVIDEMADEIRMLGSLRAAKQCLDCHDVDRGELLGAFTYHLRRVAPTSKSHKVAIAEQRSR